MSHKVCFLYANRDFALDGIRSALGLAVENHYAYGVVLIDELGELNEYHTENIEWVRDMEGDVFSNVQANCDNNGLTPITIEELGQKLREMDYIIPFGTY